MLLDSFEERVEFYNNLLKNRDLAVFVACVEGKAPSSVVSIVLNTAMGAAFKRRFRDKEFKEEFTIDLPVTEVILEVVSKYGMHEHIECKRLMDRLLRLKSSSSTQG